MGTFTLDHVKHDDLRGELRLGGRLSLEDGARLWAALLPLEAAARRGETLDLEMSGVERVDGGAMALLASLRTRLHQRGVASEFVAASERVGALVHLYGGDLAVGRVPRPRAVGTLDQLGRATAEILHEGKLVLAFVGELVVSGVGLLRSPRSANWRELPPSMERAGADAVPIVAAIGFLVGLATAFQAAELFKRYGAAIFVADLVGISMCRELGPLMTAIVVCGRTGAAYTAELGFMQVNEEVDALRTMGLGPMRYLVVPRLVALVLVLPLLVIIADVAGVAGGLLVGVWNLDLSVLAYLNETVRALAPWDVATGLLKSVAFALAIALISCQQGLATRGGAEGVGRRTTASVVSTLFTLVLVDAATTVFFRAVGV